MLAYQRSKALLQEAAKSLRNDVPGGSLSPPALLITSPLASTCGGHSTCWLGDLTRPVVNRAVEGMVLFVNPRATCAGSAESFPPALFATARISPVLGWITPIELSACAW